MKNILKNFRLSKIFKMNTSDLSHENVEYIRAVYYWT